MNAQPLVRHMAARRWHERLAFPLSTDPEGAFVAELDGRIIGAAEAIVRERLWTLSLFAVLPDIQSSGAGRALLEDAIAYAHQTDAGLIVSSNDPRALRLYARHGFALHPTFRADGARRTLHARDPLRALLWHALAEAGGPVRVRWITGAQQWAIDVLTRARLEVTAYGALCVRGAPGSLRPFLPSAPFA